MTASERLSQLAGSGTAGCLLKRLGLGVSTSDALVDYSRLTSATACRHLLTDVRGNGRKRYKSLTVFGFAGYRG
jgi:hypothetical protein